MHYRRLGRAGLKVSELSFGSWVTYANQVDTGLAHKLSPEVLARIDELTLSLSR